MRTVIQRVKHVYVRIKDETVGQISEGLLVLFAVHVDDTQQDISWLAQKIVNLRIFEDEAGKMNRSVKDVGGSILVVSQFTLYGDCRNGNRPSFIRAARPEKAKEYYEQFVRALRDLGITTETGRFQENMQVSLINDGPTTVIIDSQSA